MQTRGGIPATPAKLTIYSKEDCPLCEEMEAAVREAAKTVPLELSHIDVTKDPALFAQYGMDIPLIFMDGSCIAKHRVRGEELVDKIKRRRGR